jgi:DNA-binding NtrC family response regulator
MEKTPAPPPLCLVVMCGPATGARLRVGAATLVIGRAREADLVLPDRHASRAHVRVTAAGGEIRVEVCPGAKQILVNGNPAREGLVRVGDGLVIGDTALVVSEDLGEAHDAPAGKASRTDVHTLMTGVGADVQGLATVMALVDALDAAADEAAVEPALKRWGAEHLAASEVALTASDGDPGLEASPGSAPALVERPGPRAGTTLLSAPAHHAEAAWVTFTCEGSGPRVTTTTRRLVVVAGRMASGTLTRLRSLRRAEEEREMFRQAAVGAARSFLGDSAAATEVAKLVPRLAKADATVLLEGETGVGKTFLARLLHDGGPRSSEPLRIINCAAIPEALIESELFGHERGAFTGATSARAGALEAAGRGTVLLDEIGELPLASQAKLLRVLEEKRFERLGSNRPLHLEARVLAATNRDLARMAEEGTFRLDLFYRIAVVKLRVPPLRERGDDLLLLANRILADLAQSAGRRVEGFSTGALDAIRRYAWPGNVRELRNAIERALVVGEGRWLEPADLPAAVHGAPAPQPDDDSLVRLPARMDVLEARAIQAALRATGGNQRQAALLLGIGRTTLHRKLHPGTEGDAGD